MNYITDQVTKKLQATIQKKKKNNNVKPLHIKNHLWVFVNAIIENPAFDSQTKVNMTLKKSKFGSTCVLDDKIIKKVSDSGIMENVLNWASFKESKELKKSDGMFWMCTLTSMNEYTNTTFSCLLLL